MEVIANTVDIKMKNKGGRPRKGDDTPKLWADDEYKKNYNNNYYMIRKSRIGMSKCEECGFECATNYLTKHKMTKYHLLYIERNKKNSE